MSSLFPAPASRHVPTLASSPRDETMHDKPGVDRHLWEIRPIRDLLIFGALAGLLWFLYQLPTVFLPVFIALLFAYLVSPFVGYAFRQWSVPRPLTVGILMLLLTLIFVGLGFWLIPLLIEQAQTLIQKIPVYARSLSQRYQDLLSSSFNLRDLL